MRTTNPRIDSGAVDQGDSIIQDVFNTYLLVENDNFVNNQRTGDFGSTDD